MSNKSVTKLKRGYDIKILDQATEDIKNLGIPKQVAVKPIDFEGFKSKPSVAVGDRVKAGDELAFDKNNEKVKLTAPTSGKVIAINRGHRRIITEIVIEPDGNHEATKFNVGENLNHENVLEVLFREIFLFPH